MPVQVPPLQPVSVYGGVGLPVIVENDADSGLWAEARFGAARGYQDVMMISVGTGIGAAILIGGDLYHGRYGIAGEPGHYRVVPDGRLCGCGNRGCWEQYASGSSLEYEARDFALRTPGGAVRLLQLGIQTLSQTCMRSQQAAPSAHLSLTERLLPGRDLDGGRGRHDGSCYKGPCYPEHSSVGATFLPYQPRRGTPHSGLTRALSPAMSTTSPAAEVAASRTAPKRGSS